MKINSEITPSYSSSLPAEFRAAFFSQPSLQSTLSDTVLLGKIYEPVQDSILNLICIHSHGNINAYSPFSYNIRSFPYYMLIYTKSGEGSLVSGTTKYILSEQTLLFFDCRQSFTLNINLAPWNFDIYFLSGSNLDVFMQKINPLKQPFSVKSRDNILQCLTILDQNYFHYTERNPLLDYSYIGELFVHIMQAFLDKKKETAKIAPYLSFMKKNFDTSYSKGFSLQYFEDTLQISRYRLCREFSKQFGISPIQYLNMQRINAAKNLLHSTDMPIHEIASNVGIDNANHFINIFKKFTNQTPYSYRQNPFHEE